MTDTIKGKFIVFDGLPGTGKTTQINIVADLLRQNGHHVVLTREPGGTTAAEEVRDLVVNGEPDRWDGISELFLFSAARRNHIETIIKPALEVGSIVLCDRFVASTYAYQGYGRSIPIDTINQITNIATGLLNPDLTFIFFIDPKLGRSRAIESRSERLSKEPRFVANEISLERVSDGFYAFLKEKIQYIELLAAHDIQIQERYIPVFVNDDTGINDITKILMNEITRLLN